MGLFPLSDMGVLLYGFPTLCWPFSCSHSEFAEMEIAKGIGQVPTKSARRHGCNDVGDLLCGYLQL